MPIDFPSNPTNGQVYGTYVYDSSITAWRNLNTDAGATQLATSVGLRNIVPTSIAKGASGSASVNSNGTVSFTATESVSLNGVFSSAYEKYVITFTINAATVTTQLRFRLRAAGVDQTGNYLWGGNQANHAGTASAFYGAQNSVVLGDFSNQSATTHSSVMDIFNPFLSQRKSFTHRFMYDNLTYVFGGSFGGYYQATTSCDGFTIYPGAAGNFSGTVQVFGYNN